MNKWWFWVFFFTLYWIIHSIIFDEWILTSWALAFVLTAWLPFVVCNAQSPTSNLFKVIFFHFFSPVRLKASIPIWCATTSPWDTDSRLCSPQAKLAPFTSSPGKHLTLVIHRHGMGATTRHQCYLLSIQSSYQLCGEEDQLRLQQFHDKQIHQSRWNLDFRV